MRVGVGALPPVSFWLKVFRDQGVKGGLVEVRLVVRLELVGL